MSNDLSIYYQTASQLKLPVLYRPELNYLQISLGKKYLFMPYLTPFNNSASIYLARNRQAQNQLLKQAGFPVPKAIVIYRRYFNASVLDKLLQYLHFPLLLRPRVDSIGKNDVIPNINDKESLLHFIQLSLKKYSSLQIMEFYQGLKEYQILMLHNRVLSVLERVTSPEIEPIRYLPKKLSLENESYLTSAAQLMDLEFLSFKILSNDFDKPWHETEWVLLDASFCPDISLHEVYYPVAKEILKQLISRHPIAYFLNKINPYNMHHFTKNESYG